jgi:predicted phage terminase large subunit-like protein
VQIVVEQEPGSGGLESAQATVRMLAGYPVFAEKVTGSKETRAEPLAAQCEAGNVKILRAAWNGDFLDEILAFPSSRYTDQVDACAGGFNKLATREPAFADDELPIAGKPNQFFSYPGRFPF